MSSARQLKTLQKTDFDRLLAWLDPNPDRAGQLYEKIRWRLIAILASRLPASASWFDTRS